MLFEKYELITSEGKIVLSNYDLLKSASEVLKMKPVYNVVNNNIEKQSNNLVTLEEKFFNSFNNKLKRNDIGEIYFGKHELKSLLVHTPRSIDKYAAI